MSSPEETKFVKDAFAELDEMEIGRLDANEKVKQFITAPETNITSINYGNVEIRFRVFMSKNLRHKMMRGQKLLENAKDEEALLASEKTMYEILGQLCVDEPWSDWKTWAYIDEKTQNTGGVQSIFLQVLAQISAAVEDVKNFRRR